MTWEAALPKVPLCNAGTRGRLTCSLARDSERRLASLGLRWNDGCKDLEAGLSKGGAPWSNGPVSVIALPPYRPDADKGPVDKDKAVDKDKECVEGGGRSKFWRLSGYHPVNVCRRG